ncbi:MAG: hypothetical protein GSR84_08085 [Desulfurococcales archaeon]|nr:hypothetical protein [Desulfurococcales archaeon]
MARSPAVVAILYTIPIVVGIIAEFNVRYLIERWPLLPGSLVAVTAIAALASLASGALILYMPGPTLLRASLAQGPAIWGFYLTTILYYAVGEALIPKFMPPGLGLLPGLAGLLVAGPLASSRHGAAYGVGMAAAGGIGVAAVSMFIGLHLIRLEEEWDRLAGTGIILVSTSAVIAGLTLYTILAREVEAGGG